MGSLSPVTIQINLEEQDGWTDRQPHQLISGTTRVTSLKGPSITSNYSWSPDYRISLHGGNGSFGEWHLWDHIPAELPPPQTPLIPGTALRSPGIFQARVSNPRNNFMHRIRMILILILMNLLCQALLYFPRIWESVCTGCYMITYRNVFQQLVLHRYPQMCFLL